VVRAVAEVEARGSGFLRNSDLPAILFEGHIFHRLTGGRFSKAHPTISYPAWTKQHYKGGRGEYDRLAAAAKLDREAALKSASWGRFQIMGFNHRAAGFETVEDFVNAMGEGEGEHLRAFGNFLEANPRMVEALCGKQWAEFARRYNGPGYAQNQYDAKMAAEFASAKADPHDLERADWMALQAALNVVGDAGLAVDGWSGPKTTAALIAHQKRAGLPTSGEPDEATLKSLGLAREAA
jgi:hypothetical protein